MKLFPVLFTVISIYIFSSKENDKNEKYYHFPNDTLLQEDIDASDFILSYRFKYEKNDTAASNLLMEEQIKFLKTMHIPSSGFEEIDVNTQYDFDRLIKTYNENVVKLQNHPYKSLYRQASSQMLVKYFCSSNIVDEAYIMPPHNKLLFS
jgi:hypothetical protein